MGVSVDKTKKKIEEAEHVIEKIPGDQLTEEETMKAFQEDFGDEIEDISESTSDDMENILTSRSPNIPDPDEEEETGDVISSDGKTIRRSDGTIEKVDEKLVREGSTETVDLSQYVAKEKFNTLQADFNKLQGEHNQLKGKMPKEFEGISSEDILVFRGIKNDIETTPLGMIIQDFYEDKLDPSIFAPKKSVKNYLEDGEEYNHEDAVMDQTSASWKAREAWESDRKSYDFKYKQASEYATKKLKESVSREDLSKKAEEGQKVLLEEFVQKIPTASKDSESFMKWVNNQQNPLVPLYLAFRQVVKSASKRTKDIEPSPVRGEETKVLSDEKFIDDTFGD